jgi:hypothetical protein
MDRRQHVLTAHHAGLAAHTFREKSVTFFHSGLEITHGYQSREDRKIGARAPAPARFAAMARCCAAGSWRRGRSLFPMLAPVLELQDPQAGRRLDGSCVPPRTTGTT